MAESDLRAEYLQKLAQADAEAKANNLFSMLSGAGGLESVGGQSPRPADLEGDEEFVKAAELIADKSQTTGARVLALESASVQFGEDERLFDAAFNIVQDAEEPPSLRAAVLRLLQQSSFHSTIYRARHDEIMAALRAIVDNDTDDQQLRQQAAQFLALNHDETIQNRLIEGLTNPDKAFLAPEVAIRFLGYDVHATKPELLRSIIENPPSIEAKREAVRLLAADPGSQTMLANMLEDKSEDLEVRNACAVGLHATSPATFATQSQQIVLDDDDDDDLRATCLSGFTRKKLKEPKTEGLESIDESASDFYQKLNSMKAGATGSLRKAIDEFLKRM